MGRYSKVVTGLTTVSGMANCAIGALCTVLYLEDVDVTESVLAAYLCLFGLIQFTSQWRKEDRMNLTILRSNLGFLSSYTGLGFYLLFVGSLGLSFTTSKEPKKFLPFFSGLVTCVIALLNFGRIFTKKDPEYTAV
ncbi:hypothetical protein DIPPA_26823 [Diplonema papillatum]|nr:hypothetical protein DIPPA_26823 [Diplonema papillatum]